MKYLVDLASIDIFKVFPSHNLPAMLSCLFTLYRKWYEAVLCLCVQFFALILIFHSLNYQVRFVSLFKRRQSPLSNSKSA